MLKMLKKILIVFVCVFTVMPTIYADNAGGTGSGGGAQGGTGSSTSSDNMYWQTGTQSQVRVSAYRFDLVYKPKNGNRYILKTVVAQDNSNKSAGSWCSGSSRDFLIKLVKNYTSVVNSMGESKYGAVYKDKGELVELARELSNGKTIDGLFPDGKVTNESKIKDYITSADGFNIDESELQLEQDENQGTYNSYGYRILIQKIQVYARGNLVNCSSYFKFAATRKDVTGNPALLKKLTGNNLPVYIAPANVAGIGEDIWTTRFDIMIDIGEHYAFDSNATGLQIRDKAKYFADWNNGLGYNILWFSTKPFKGYDYSIDAACVNCNSNDDDNKAYIIQDINDWNAIFESSKSSNKNIKTYFNKGNGVYCREEYWVYLPNVNNTIYVEPGRYFTLNPSASDLNSIITNPTIPNFKPVKVVKKRQCRVNTSENNGNTTNILNNFRINSEYDFQANTGTVKFKYNERYEDSHYNMKDAEVMRPYNEGNNYTYSINSNILEMQTTKYYTLPENYYQYIRKQDGLSVKTKPSSDINHYINVGIPNLPISFNNIGEDSNDTFVAADIQFSYELPGKNKDTDKYSSLYKAYVINNDYLKDSSSKENIYKKYLSNKMENGDQALIENSACAKMFGFNTSAFKSCATQRTNNSIGTGSNSCINKNKINTSNTSGYSCMILTRGDTSDCKTEEDAKRLGLDWNPYNNTCCPVGTYYNPNLGKCSNDTCRIENGKYYDYDGKEITKEEYDRICPYGCKIENGKYYDFEGKEITKEEYDRICPSDIPPVCPEDECPYGCCPSGECAPMSTINGEPICPGGGGIDVIYRTIDLRNPFPGQNAEQRHTGSNWCNYNIRTQQIECEYNNPVSNEYIIRERGGNVNGGKVYREGHVLYEVTLDTATINSIRSYNDDNKYDDWDLNCDDDGKACISDFLRKEVDVTGECARVSKSNFYDCDEDV